MSGAVNRECILGIDPGLTGAVAFYFPHEPALIAVEDLPVAASELDAASLAHLIAVMKPDVAVIERGGARPGQGVVSMFGFGVTCGIIRGVIAALRIPTHLVAPRSWKKHFRLGPEKDLARAHALALWPACAERFARKRDHGRAEAALIARYFAETRS